MTKPWEETWRHDDDASVWIGDGPDSIMFFDPSPDGGTMARARLAAQAPAMARLLLESLADRGTDDYHFAGSDEEARIEAVLRAAGVIAEPVPVESSVLDALAGRKVW